MKGLDKVIWSNLYSAINAEGKEKLVNIIKQDNMFDWSRIGKGNWPTVLQTYPEAADKCPWSELRLDIMVDISRACGTKFESLYDYSKVGEYDIMRRIRDCPDNDSSRQILLRLMESCGFSKLTQRDNIIAIADQNEAFGVMMFKNLSKEQMCVLDKSDWDHLLYCNPEYMKYTPVDVFGKITKRTMLEVVRERPRLSSKIIPIDVMCDRVPLSSWHEVAKKVPTFLKKLDAKKLKGYNARKFIEDNPTVLMSHNMTDFGMNITDWKRMLKSKPDIIKYLPPDYEHSLVILALKKKAK